MTELNFVQMEILKAKEIRWIYQKELIDKFQQSLIVFKFNIPGWPKKSKEILSAFYFALRDFESFLSSEKITFNKIKQKETQLGPEAFFTSTFDGKKIKTVTIKFEETHQIGRLLDIDVISKEKTPVERTLKRKCFLCERIALECMYDQKHSSEELQNYFYNNLREYLKEKIS